MVVKIRIATEADARNRLLRSDMKRFLRVLPLPYRGALGYFYGVASKAECELVDLDGNRATLLELSDADLDAFDYWYRDWIKTDEVHAEPRLRVESAQRIVLLITLLRMIFPKETSTWGKPLVVVRTRLAA